MLFVLLVLLLLVLLNTNAVDVVGTSDLFVAGATIGVRTPRSNT
jgi:hypothetical protein